MSLKSSFYTFLSSHSSITDLLGATNAIYLNRIPQQLNTVLPAVTYRQQNDQDIALLDGTVSQLAFAEMEVWCWAATGPAAEQLAEAVRSALVGYSGTMGANEVDPIRKQFDDGDLEVETGLHFVRLQFSIPYR